jgi:hypothetical protein
MLNVHMDELDLTVGQYAGLLAEALKVEPSISTEQLDAVLTQVLPKYRKLIN